MSFAGVEPWRDGLYPLTDAHIPVEDGAAWASYPEHNWVYDRLGLTVRLGRPAAPCGVDTLLRPLVVKPITNLWGLGIAATVVEAGEAIPYRAGSFWSPKLAGEHLSIDLVVDRLKVLWSAQAVGHPGPVFGTFDAWELGGGDPFYLPAGRLGALVGYRGLLNVETIGGQVIEMHLRPSSQFVDLYPPGWVDAVIGFHQGRRWAAVPPAEPGWSIPAWAPPGRYTRTPDAALPGGCWLSGDAVEAPLSALTRLGYANHRDRASAQAGADKIGQAFRKAG